MQTSTAIPSKATKLREPRTVEELLDQVEQRARHGLKRDLLHVASDAEAALDERLVRRHPWLALSLAAAAGFLAVWFVPRGLRIAERMLRSALGFSQVLRLGSAAAFARRVRTAFFA